MSNSNEISLSSLMKRQRELMTVLGMSERPVEDVLTSPIYKDVLINLMEEVSEALKPTALSTKPWKWAKADELREETKEETIDIFFFLMEAWLVAGISPEEVERRYERKRQHILNDRLRKALEPSPTEFSEAPLNIYQRLHRIAGMLSGVKSRRDLWDAIFKYESLGSENWDESAIDDLYQKALVIFEKANDEDKKLLAEAIGMEIISAT